MGENIDISFKNLAYTSKSSNIKSYVEGLSDDEVISFYMILSRKEDTTGELAGIVSALKEERKRRFLDKYLFFECNSESDSISKNIIETFRFIDIEKSCEFLYDRGIDTDKMFLDCPLILSIDKFSKLYGTLKVSGKSDEEILELVTQPALVKYINDERYFTSRSLLHDYVFAEFLRKLNNYIIEKKKKNN